MRIVSSKEVQNQVITLVRRYLISPDEKVTERLKSLDDEPTPKAVAQMIAKNNETAKLTNSFCCQDTGQAVFFIKLGDQVICEGLYKAIVEGTRIAYADARKSVADPLTRLNTKDNTPPIIETELCNGDGLEISFIAKGAGSENMSKLYMLTPADGTDGIISSVVDAVSVGGPNACPPLVVGVGIGGVSETACTLSKKALLRPLGDHNPRNDVAELEKTLLQKINALGIGIGGFGGRHTALAVNIEVAPTHIGMLPIAVNLQCHSVRHGRITL